MTNDGSGEKNGRLEQLEKRIQELLAAPQPPEFVRYLQALVERVRNQRYQIDLLGDELDRRERFYRDREQESSRNETETQQESPAAEQISDITGQITDMPGESPVAPERSPVMPVQKEEKTAEYTLGAIILCVVGGGFILTALVMLGQVLMSSLTAGMMFYGISLLLLGLAELVLYRRWKALGIVFSAISIGGLYLSTVVNYLFFGNFGEVTAVQILSMTTLLTIVISRRRKSVWYRVMGLIACYLCILPMRQGMTEEAFYQLLGSWFVVNLFYLFWAVPGRRLSINVVHMIANSFFYCILLDTAYGNGMGVQICLAATACTIFVMQLICVIQLRSQYKEAALGNAMVSGAGIMTAYGISTAVICIPLRWVLRDAYTAASPEMLLGMLLTITILWVVSFLLLRRTTQKWYLVYSFCALTYALFRSNAEYHAVIGSLLGLYLLVKLLGFWEKRRLSVCDAVLTTLVCMRVIYDRSWQMKGYFGEEAWLLAAGVLVGILLIHTCKAYQEIVLTFTLAVFAARSVPVPLDMPVFVGIIFVGILLYNNVKYWKNKDVQIYNIFALLGVAVALFELGRLPVYREASIAYLSMLVFGLAAIVLTLREPYGMETKCRTFIACVFLSYMALIFQTDYPVVNSILLMLAAFGSVVAGFVDNRKPVRIYGVVLSLLVCAKLVLYDFWGVATLQKTLLFFAVGVLALAIAILYMTLERRKRKTEGKRNQDREGITHE